MRESVIKIAKELASPENCLKWMLRNKHFEKNPENIRWSAGIGLHTDVLSQHWVSYVGCVINVAEGKLRVVAGCWIWTENESKLSELENYWPRASIEIKLFNVSLFYWDIGILAMLNFGFRSTSWNKSTLCKQKKHRKETHI